MIYCFAVIVLELQRSKLTYCALSHYIYKHLKEGRLEILYYSKEIQYLFFRQRRFFVVGYNHGGE